MKLPVDGYHDKYCIFLNKLPHDHTTKLQQQFLLDFQLLIVMALSSYVTCNSETASQRLNY
jgi:hypothetical protein